MEEEIRVFEKDIKCKGIACKKECVKYKNLKEKYCKSGKLILQPSGVQGKHSGFYYYIQYDVQNAEFVPSRKYGYDNEDIAYIMYHINQFRLNDINFKTRALAEFVEDTVNADGKYTKAKNRYSNYIVDLFAEKLDKLSQHEVLKLCEELYITYQKKHIYS